MLELSTTHPEQESGMGHIHVATNARDATIVFANAILHPYLTWIFATQMGSKHCKSSLGALIAEDCFGFKCPGARDPRPAKNSYSWYLSSSNSYGIPYSRFTAFAPRQDLGTVEIRLFDSAEDWNQQAEHIAFAQRFVEFSIKTVKQKGPIQYVENGATMKKLVALRNKHRFDIDLCIKDFKSLLEKLELPFSIYERYIDKNLVPAFEYGKRL